MVIEHLKPLDHSIRVKIFLKCFLLIHFYADKKKWIDKKKWKTQ